MRARLRSLIAALGLLGLLAGCAAPQEQARGGCPTRQLADLPAEVGEAGVLVPVTVNGNRLTLKLDTGASGLALLSTEGARRAGVQAAAGEARPHWGLSGRNQTETAQGVTVALAGLLPRTGPVALAPAAGSGMLGEGVLGAAAFAGHDVEIDPREGRVRFHAVPPDCTRLVPFATPYAAIPLLPGPAGLVYVPMRLDGGQVLALLDTGANGTLLLDPGIDRLGLRERVAAAGPSGIARDWSGNSLPGVTLTFQEVMIGPARARNRQIPYVAAPMRIADAILGRDYLLARRIWISYATMTLFILR